MARYLSPEWFDEVNAAFRTSRPPAAAASSAPRFTVQQVVTGGRDGEVRYWVRLEGGAIEAGLGQAEGADVTVCQSHDTAAAVASGELSAEAALVAGQIRVSGDATLLLEHQALLRDIAEALAPVRRRASYR
ncbi:MAG: SCP2 sterol-binding domain-containing protein [Actinomycetota bacterium]|nr:SCP2 sterol-binding domain-containing protein [Actinomycetota bacterium]